MTIGSCFSGIGGELVAASMLGWDVKFFCEKNPFGNRVLSYWYPNAKNYEDITTADFTEWRGRVDVLTGGFPCQPFSYAGRRRGAEDDRYLWPAMHNAIDQVRPTWVVAENVAGITTMVEQGEVSPMASQASLFDEEDGVRGYRLSETFTLERICNDLESHGYSVQPILIPACAVGAPHRRDRVFIVARRIASDTDNGADRRTAREDEGKGREERIQERHEVRKPDEPNQVRPEGATIPQDSMHSRQLYGQDEVEGSERNIGNVGAGGGERICGETSRTVAADTACGREGTPRPSGESESSRGDTHQQPSERRAETERLDRLHAILRPSADPSDIGAGKQCECGRGQHREPRTFESRNGHWPCPSCEWDYCGERWRDFPSVSPVCGRYDGLSRNVVRYINDKVYDELKEHFRNEDLSSVWQVFQSPQVRQSLGRLYKIHETDLLLKVVFGAQTGRRPESDGDGLSARSDEVSERVLRKLRKQRASSCASQRLQHQEQLTRELGYALPALSFDLALAAKTIEEEVLRMMTYIRTESLKAYGNAIVPQVMYEIFRAIQIVSEQ